MKHQPEKIPEKKARPSADVDGQMTFEGGVVPPKAKKPRAKAHKGPIHPKHRVFNLHITSDGTLVLDPNQFVEKPPEKKP